MFKYIMNKILVNNCCSYIHLNTRFFIKEKILQIGNNIKLMKLLEKKTQISNRSRNGLANSQITKPIKAFQTKSSQINMDVRQCIERINLKMQNSKMQTLHPPFFQKTLTKFRQEGYGHKLKKQIDESLVSQSQSEFKEGLSLMDQFIDNFDEDFIDNYVQQIRQPYIRKIFNESYEIDKVNFKKLNSQYELSTYFVIKGKQIEEVLNQTSQWLIQIQILEDVMSRIQLYFNIKCQSIMEKLKTEGAEDRKGSWIDSFRSLIRQTTSYALRKGSKVVQNTGYASMLSPAFAMLTWAIIGGNTSIPWKGGLDAKTILIPILAFTVPYMLDSMAQSIERSDFKSMLQNWAEQFEKINDSLRHFNQMLLKQINFCSQSLNKKQYQIHVTNLSKYVDNLSKQVDKVSNYDEQNFEEMRERTEAYFTNYVQIQEGEWTTVMTPQQYEKHVKNSTKQQQK